MGLFANFVGRAMARKMEDVTSRMEKAGQRGVDVARGLAPIRTGRLRESIHYIYDQSSMTLTLLVDAPYGRFVDSRVNFTGPAKDAMRQTLRGGTVESQFATLGEKYQPKARLLTAGTNTIIGHRKRVKFRR